MASNGENSTPPSTPSKPIVGISALTEREGEILAKAWSCLKNAPEVDYEKLAEELGMTNHRSASNAWATIRKKMQWTAQATPGGTGKSAGGKRKKAATTNSDDANANAEEVEATPVKKVKATPKKPRAAATPKKAKSSAVAKNSSDEEKTTSKGGKAAGGVVKKKEDAVKDEDDEPGVV